LAEPTIDTIPSFSPVGFRKGRTVGIVGFVTVAVSAIGYLRESALAARFGVSTTMDAYFAAIFIPNILYFVLVAGTVSPVFIPILLKEGATTARNNQKLSASLPVLPYWCYWL